jgi:hypothetical protein
LFDDVECGTEELRQEKKVFVQTGMLCGDSLGTAHDLHHTNSPGEQTRAADIGNASMTFPNPRQTVCTFIAG